MQVTKTKRGILITWEEIEMEIESCQEAICNAVFKSPTAVHYYAARLSILRELKNALPKA